VLICLALWSTWGRSGLVILQDGIPSRVSRGWLVGYRGGNRQLDLGARAGFAHEIQLSAHALCPFANADQSLVSGAATFLQDLRVYAFAVIANTQAKQVLIVEDPGFDVARTSVQKGIS
jgi:hypothetical protein